MQTQRTFPGAGLALATLLTFTLGAASLRATDVEGNLDKSFTVAPGGTFVLEADRGSVTVNAGAADKAEIKVFRKVSASSTAKGEEILAKHEITFAQEGTEVRVKAKSNRASSGFDSLWNRLQVRYEITLPRQFNPHVTTAGGSITIAEFQGDIRAQTAGGSIRVGRTEGPVFAKTAGGSIQVAGATGRVDAQTAGGSIKVEEAGGELVAETAGGSIEIGKAAGRVKAHTAGGGITIKEAAGKVDAHTAGGSIRVGLTSSPEEDCVLETAAGSIHLQLPSTASAEIDAVTSAGRVSSDLPVTVKGEVKNSSLRGKLGSGGKLVRLRTSGGSIHLESR